MQSLLGILLLLGSCYLLSERRADIPWRLVIIGLLLQSILALLLTRVEWIAQALGQLNYLVSAVESATLAGTSFLFGYLGGDILPFTTKKDAATYLFAFRVLPQVVVFSAIVAVLWHSGILPLIVRGFGWALRKSLGVSGAEGTAGAASIFLGMVETPLMIKAYLRRMTRAQLFTVMTFGMSTVAGSVMVLYAVTLADTIPNVVGHLLSASLLNVVGAIYISRLLIPEANTPLVDLPAQTNQDQAPEAVSVDAARSELQYASTIDAITRGTSDGLGLAMNVGAMLLVFVSLVALANGLLGLIEVSGAALSLQRLLGWLFAPVAWVIGIPWQDAPLAGSLLGTKLVLNELVAFLELSAVADQLTATSRLILMYALCGFANFGSLGILLGGLTTLIPERREECLAIAPLSIVSGTLVTLLTAALIATVNPL